MLKDGYGLGKEGWDWKSEGCDLIVLSEGFDW